MSRRICSGSVAPKPQTKGIDLDAPGNINGVSVYEFDISSLKDDERPWRKPGECQFVYVVSVPSLELVSCNVERVSI